MKSQDACFDLVELIQTAYFLLFGRQEESRLFKNVATRFSSTWIGLLDQKLYSVATARADDDVESSRWILFVR
jgi:hypothetical protein